MWSKARSCTVVVMLVASIGMVEAGLAQEPIKPFGRRIVGGEKTDISQHLWQVALQFKGDFFCGGSIIGQRWVLTAAHCFQLSTRGGDWRAKAGATNHATMGDWSEVERVIVHERYNPTTYENDIALIKLRSPSAGRVIQLAAASMTVPISQPLEVTGWGATQEGGGGSKELLKARVPYVDIAACNEPAAYNGRVRPNMMCAGNREGGIDSCQGDSGGPLVWRTSDGPVLVGVVSFGDGCARKLKYGIYTRVSAYRDWIDRAMAANPN
jgi:secreted trypsin-like serine protease